MRDKSCCFAGHRDRTFCYGIEDKVPVVLENLILQGYTTFYDGHMGYFDSVCLGALRVLKRKYPFIRIIRVDYRYIIKQDENIIPDYVDETIFVGLENVHYKMKIVKRNQWIVDNSDCLVCHINSIVDMSGAKRMRDYAKRKNKKIIEI